MFSRKIWPGCFRDVVLDEDDEEEENGELSETCDSIIAKCSVFSKNREENLTEHIMAARTKNYS